MVDLRFGNHCNSLVARNRWALGTTRIENTSVGIIVSAMTAEGEAAAVLERQKLQADQEIILDEIRSMREEMRKLHMGSQVS